MNAAHMFDVELVHWSKPRVVQTARGLRQLRSWRIPKYSEFWPFWRSGGLDRDRYSISKWNGEWSLCEWRLPPGRETRVEPPSSSTDGHIPQAWRRRWKRIERIYAEILRETGDDFTFQFPSIRRLALAVDRHSGALDASDTGTGKTAVACAVALLLGRALFVCCPKNVIPPWERMAARFGVTLVIINYEMLRTGRTPFGGWGESRRAKTFMFADLNEARTLFVFDECHRMKDYRTLNCAVGIGAIEAGYKVLALSATAADNPMHMKFVTFLCGLVEAPSHFYGWMLHNGVRRGRFGLEFVGGRRVISNIHDQIFPQRGSRIR